MYLILFLFSFTIFCGGAFPSANLVNALWLLPPDHAGPLVLCSGGGGGGRSHGFETEVVCRRPSSAQGAAVVEEGETTQAAGQEVQVEQGLVSRAEGTILYKNRFFLKIGNMGKYLVPSPSSVISSSSPHISAGGGAISAWRRASVEAVTPPPFRVAAVAAAAAAAAAAWAEVLAAAAAVSVPLASSKVAGNSLSKKIY